MSDQATHNRDTGAKLARLGADIYQLADNNPGIEEMPDFQEMMFRLNKLSYFLLNGKERP